MQKLKLRNTEAGDIPEDWEISSIDSFLKINMGQSPPSETYNEHKRGLPFYQGVSDFSEMFPKSRIWCSIPKKIAYPNEILFSVRAPVGELNLTNEKCCIGRGIASLIPIQSDLKYCFYLIKLFKDRFSAYSQGSTFEAINRDEIGRVKLPFTSNIKEQQKIASILSKVDELIQKTDQIIEQTQKLKNGLTEQLLKKGIGHKQFKKSTIGHIPKSWTSTTLNKVCIKIQDGSHFSPKKQYTTSHNNRFLYITSKNVKEDGIDLSKATYVDKEFHDGIYNRCNPEKGDVLLVKDGVMTGTAVINTLDEPFSLLSSVALIKTQKSVLNPEYLKHYLMSSLGFYMITNQMTGTAIKRIILDRIRASPIPLPPVMEQGKISSILSKLDELTKLKKLQNLEMKKIKKGLMQKLLTGKVRVKV